MAWEISNSITTSGGQLVLAMISYLAIILAWCADGQQTHSKAVDDLYLMQVEATTEGKQSESNEMAKRNRAESNRTQRNRFWPTPAPSPSTVDNYGGNGF